MKNSSLLISLFLLLFCACENEKEPSSFNWKALDNKFEASLCQVEFINDQTGFIGGSYNDDYYFAKTTDGGATWEEVKLDISDDKMPQMIRNIYFFDEQNGFVSVSTLLSGIIGFKTTNQGKTWSVIHNGYLIPDRFVFSCPDTGFIFGRSSDVYYTFNGGNTWQNYLDTNFRAVNYIGDIFITDIRFLENNSRIGFLSGQSGEIYYTTDGGIVWNIYNSDWAKEQQPLPGAEGIFFYSFSEGFIFNDNGIYKTADTGKNFALVNSNSAQISHTNGFDYLKVSYISKDEIYIQGGKEIYKTNDGFKTLTTLSVEERVTVSDFEVLPSGIGFVVGTKLSNNEEYGVVLKYSSTE